MGAYQQETVIVIEHSLHLEVVVVAGAAAGIVVAAAIVDFADAVVAGFVSGYDLAAHKH